MKYLNKGITSLLIILIGNSCASTKTETIPMIENPFGNSFFEGEKETNIILRSKEGQKSVEVELPRETNQMTEFVVPMDATLVGQRTLASNQKNQINPDYKKIKPSTADHEIIEKLPEGIPENDWKRSNIENELGLVTPPEAQPKRQSSYLAQIDYIKQLYRNKRYEVGLLETDEMIKSYPTDPKLYEMRGTLLERLGYSELAMRSWEQSVEFDPNNESLKKFIQSKKKKLTLRGSN
tara:strand:- start:216 stop:926 length:711 start_codon:yes stop_codon:yes gene_type:complete